MRAVLQRFHTPLFLAICIVGVVLSVSLGAFEVSRRPPVDVGDPVDERTGLISVVHVEVTNRSDVGRCPDIRIAARDRDDRDLEEHRAVPVEGGERLAPGETRTYQARFTELVEQDYDEELKEFAAFAWESPEC